MFRPFLHRNCARFSYAISTTQRVRIFSSFFIGSSGRGRRERAKSRQNPKPAEKARGEIRDHYRWWCPAPCTHNVARGTIFRSVVAGGPGPAEGASALFAALRRISCGRLQRRRGESPDRLYGQFVAELTASSIAIQRASTFVEGELFQETSRASGDPAVSPDLFSQVKKTRN